MQIFLLGNAVMARSIGQCPRLASFLEEMRLMEAITVFLRVDLLLIRRLHSLTGWRLNHLAEHTVAQSINHVILAKLSLL